MMQESEEIKEVTSFPQLDFRFVSRRMHGVHRFRRGTAGRRPQKNLYSRQETKRQTTLCVLTIDTDTRARREQLWTLQTDARNSLIRTPAGRAGAATGLGRERTRRDRMKGVEPAMVAAA